MNKDWKGCRRKGSWAMTLFQCLFGGTHKMGGNIYAKIANLRAEIQKWKIPKYEKRSVKLYTLKLDFKKKDDLQTLSFTVISSADKK